MAEDAGELISMVRSIEDALDIVRGRHRDIGMSLVSADLELLVEAKTSASAGGEVPLIPIEIGFEGEWTRVQTFRLTLTPAGGAGDLGRAEIKDELAGGILAIAEAVRKITDLHKRTWNLSNPSITVNVEREIGGTLKIGAGGGKSSHRTHTITLTFVLA